MSEMQLPKYERDEKRITVVIMGIIVPLGFLLYACKAWIDQEVLWPFNGGRLASRWTIDGDPAKAAAFFYLGVALVCASNWLFRHWGCYRLRILGIALGTLISISGAIVGTYLMWSAV